MYVKTREVKTFKDLKFKSKPTWSGRVWHAEMQFDNGYSISVAASKGHYCSPRENNLEIDEYTAFEIAILKGEEWLTGEFFLSHHEQNVAGWQSREQIDKLMKQIQEK